jgi:hypothetical protein
VWANEIVTRVVRDLDEGWKLLWIPDSKTKAGRRTFQVPELLQQYLRSSVPGSAAAHSRRPQHLQGAGHEADFR